MRESRRGGKLCPSCLTRFDWGSAERFIVQDNKYVPFSDGDYRSEEQRDRALLQAHRKCPGGDPEHYLHEHYGDSEEPLVIGLVGGSDAGKSHLLAAMVAEIDAGVLNRRLGVLTRPLDFVQYEQYLAWAVRPLLQGNVLPRTRSEDLVLPRVSLVFERPHRPRSTVVFFDVEGEQLRSVKGANRFLHAVDGLLFVVDIDRLPRPGLRTTAGDDAFDFVRHFLRAVRRDQGPYLGVPAAIVIAKSDRRRFEFPVDDWLPGDWLGGPGNEDRISSKEILRESRDAYAFLYAAGGENWLTPCTTFERVTLHFASATGKASKPTAPAVPPATPAARSTHVARSTPVAGPASVPMPSNAEGWPSDLGPGTVPDEAPVVPVPRLKEVPGPQEFPGGAKPQRVLGPLVALLAMLGVVDDLADGEVGV